MKKIAIIHTVKSVLDFFGDQLQASCSEDLEITNILDTFLSENPDELGFVSAVCKRKLFNDMLSALDNKPDVIVVSCSAMTETVRQLRPFFDIPLVAIDENMVMKAVESGKKIRILATALSSAITTKVTIEEEAREKQKDDIEIFATDNVQAFEALQKGDIAFHDELLKKQAQEIKGYDVIVLAQASMAHMRKAIEDITGIPVLTSPDLCIEEVKALLAKMPIVKDYHNALDHIALNTPNILWLTEFFTDVFDMNVREKMQNSRGEISQLWLNESFQFIYNADSHNPLGHIAIEVNNVQEVLRRALRYEGVEIVEGKDNWLRIPGGVCLEILDE